MREDLTVIQKWKEDGKSITFTKASSSGGCLLYELYKELELSNTGKSLSVDLDKTNKVILTRDIIDDVLSSTNTTDK